MNKKLVATLEAVLFAMGEPTELSKISQVLGEDEIVLEEAIEILKTRYNKDDSGICLLRLDDKYQLCSKMEFADCIRKVIEVKKNTPLSQAAFEVLAIIAYNQPVTKSFVEQIRGVDCSGVISTLCQKKLIEEKVKAFLIDELEIDEEKIYDEANLKDDMGIDSLDFVDIVVIVERNFGFKIKPEEMVGVNTLNDFYNYIESKVAEQ